MTNGIQLYGIDDAIPKAISAGTYDDISDFFTDERMDTLVNESYDVIGGVDTQNRSDYRRLAKQYPILESGASVYVLDKIDSDYYELMNSQFAYAFMMNSAAERAGTELTQQLNEMMQLQAGENADIHDILDGMTKSQRIMFARRLSESFSDVNEMSAEQSAAVAIADEYRAMGTDVNRMRLNYILTVGAEMLGLALAGSAASVAVCVLASRVAAGFCRDIRRRIFTKVEYFSNTEFNKFSTASLITRTTNDITQIQVLIVMVIRMAFYAPVMGIGGTIRAIEKSVSMSWIIALSVIVLIGLAILVFSVVLPKFKRIQKLIDRLNLIMREDLNGIMVIRAFNSQKFEENRFDRANRELTGTNLFVNRVIITLIPFMTFLMNILTMIIVWVGAHQIENSMLQIGDMLAFMQYAMQIIMAFLMLSAMFILIPRASVSATRVAEVLETEPEISDPEFVDEFMPEKKGVVEFKDVSFRYPGADEDVLQNITFTALPGQTTAIIGSTGSGKSTLVNLIPRFYDVTKGEVFVSGANVAHVRKNDLMDKIGYVPQKAMLFSGTVESNVKYGNDKANEDEVMQALGIAQAEKFVKALPEGIDSEIAQSGTNISGGQKQRLSIARAIVKDPDIYIFDDSFSALDFKTDAALRKSLRDITSDKTVIIVAQRISTIMNAAQIIVLNDGLVVGKGTPRELMKTCSTYREIALSQLSEEDLA